MRSRTIELPEPLSRAEEVANTATHALGFVLSLVGSAVLLHRAADYGDALQKTGVSIYLAAPVSLYAASALSHSFGHPRLRHFFRTVDQVCIFLLIAGTFTPLALSFPRTGSWWALFVSVWTLALVGIVCKIFFARLNNVTLAAYVLLGWLPAVAAKPIVENMPVGPLLWIVAGGVLYTVGTVFLVRDKHVRYYHAIWHLFVIAASACHYFAVLQLVAPTVA